MCENPWGENSLLQALAKLLAEKDRKKGEGRKKIKREGEHASQEHQALLKIQCDLILHIMPDLNIVLCFITWSTWSQVPTAHTRVWMLSGFEKVGCEMPFDVV